MKLITHLNTRTLGLWLIVFGLSLGWHVSGLAQSSCQTATSYSPDPATGSDQLQFSNDSVYWVSFTAQQTELSLTAYPDAGNSNVEIDRMELFSSNCTNPQLLGTASTEQGLIHDLIYTSFSVGNSYLLKIITQEPTSNTYVLGIDQVSGVNYTWDEAKDCPCECNMIKNPKFNVANFTQHSHIITNSVPFYNGNICGWKAAIGSPKLQLSVCESFDVNSLSDIQHTYAYMFSTSIVYPTNPETFKPKTEGIYQEVDVRQGSQYNFRFRYASHWDDNGAYNPVDSLVAVFTNDTIGDDTTGGGACVFNGIIGPYQMVVNKSQSNSCNWMNVNTVFTANADYKYLVVYLHRKNSITYNEPQSSNVIVDSFYLKPILDPYISSITQATTICSGDTIPLSVGVSYNGSNPPFLASEFRYVWLANGDTVSDSHASTINVHPYVTTTYVVHAYSPINCLVKDSVTITVVQPEADFTFFPSPGCVADPVTFSDNSTCSNGIASWHWDFGDGTTATGPNPWHIYTTAGTYSVSMTSITHAGATLSLTKSLTILDKPLVPAIAGVSNTCDTFQLYTIENPEAGVSYEWYIKESSGWTQMSANTNSLLVDWSAINFTGVYTELKVVATNAANCERQKLMRIYRCCGEELVSYYNLVLLNNDTIFSPTSYNASSGDFVYINGTLHLYADLNFSDIDFLRFGPMSRIELHNGATLTFNNSFVHAGCEYMWDGIYAPGTGTHIKVLNGTKIHNAVNGLVSTEGGKITAYNSEFQDNYKSIQIRNYKKNHPLDPAKPPLEVKVAACTFNNNMPDPLVNSNYKSLMDPFTGYSSYAGILIEDVDKATIGDKSIGDNIFNRMAFGIVAKECNLRIYDNKFRNIRNVNSYSAGMPHNEGAIMVKSQTGLMSLLAQQVLIGGDNGNDNIFENCQTGVYSDGSKTIVSNNTFIEGETAVLFHTFKSASRIDSNTFRDPYNGIKVHSPINTYNRIFIRENVFAGTNGSWAMVTKRPIHLINVDSRPYAVSQIANNLIPFSGYRSGQSFGINVEHSDFVKVNSNMIKRTGVPIGNLGLDAMNFAAIRVSECKGAQITDNLSYGLTGFWTNGNLVHTQFSCNEMLLYRYGFFFHIDTYLSDQGELGVWNTHNQWHNSPVSNSQKLYTELNFILNPDTISWFYNSNFGLAFSPGDLFDPMLRIKESHNSAPHYCTGSNTGNGTSSGGGPSGGSGTGGNSGWMRLLENEELSPAERDYLFEEIMIGKDYTDLMEEYRRYEAEYLYDLLAHDQDMIFLGDNKDMDYKHFADSVANSNYGAFREVLDLLAAYKYEDAELVNAGIVAENEHYDMLKAVLGIYIDSWCKGRFELSIDEYETLLEIAMLTPYEAGSAVYTARVMLDFYTDENDVPYRLSEDADWEGKDQSIKCYPNPASSQLTIELLQADKDAEGTLQIYSLEGRLLHHASFYTSGLSVTMDISSLKNGVYLFTVKTNTTDVYQGKLVILKQ